MFNKLFKIAINNVRINALRGRKDIFLDVSGSFSNQRRNLITLKRRYTPPLKKVHEDWESLELNNEFYIYDEVSNSFYEKKDPIKLILLKSVEGLGLPGDIVDVNPDKARNSLLLPGLAVYASPYNLKKYDYLKKHSNYEIPSSQFVYKTVKLLESTVFNACMNLENPWTIEPWHAKVALRRGRFHVPESAITIPSNPISGPDLSLEGKEFLVKIKINNKEEARVRMRIHHVATEKMNRLPWVDKHWLKVAEPIFPEEAEILAELNENDPMMTREEKL